MTKEVDASEIKKKIRQTFHRLEIERLYKELSQDDEKKRKRFKQIVIDLICNDPDIDFMDRGNSDKFMQNVKDVFESNKEIDCHDDIIKAEDLHEYVAEADGPDEVLEKRKFDTTEIPSEDDKHRSDPEADTFLASNREAPNKTEEVTDQDNVYDTKKGLALVLWNTEFLSKDGLSIVTKSSRESIGNVDRENMGWILPQYNIDVIGQTEFESITGTEDLKLENASGGNLLTQEAKDKIKEVQDEIKQKEPDIFICVISTHGQESTEPVKSHEQPPSESEYEAHVVRHTLCFRDGLWDQKMYTEELVKEFSDEKCPTLKGKPRIFFIQACRSRVSEAKLAVEACEKDIQDAKEQIEACKSKIQNDEIEIDGRTIRINSEKEPSTVEENQHKIQECKDRISHEEKVIQGYQTLIKEQTMTLEACKKRLREETLAMLPANINVARSDVDSAAEDAEKEKQPGTGHRDKEEAKGASSESQPELFNGRTCQNIPAIGQTNTLACNESEVPLTQAPSQMNQPQDIRQTGDKSNIKPENAQSPEDRVSNNVQRENSETTKEVFIKYEMTPSSCYEDCLIMYASPSGKSTYGRENIGGWLIDQLFKELKGNESAEIDLLNLLTRLGFCMVKEKTTTLSVENDEKKTINFDFKLVPCIEHKLTKDVKLKRRNKETGDKC